MNAIIFVLLLLSVNLSFAEEIQCPSYTSLENTSNWIAVSMGKKRTGLDSVMIADKDGVDVREDFEQQKSDGLITYIWELSHINFVPYVKCSYREYGMFALLKLPQSVTRCSTKKNKKSLKSIRSIECELREK